MPSLATFAETASRRAAAGLALLALVFLLLPSAASAGVVITDISGVASVRRPDQYSWNQVPVNYVLDAGDEVKTDGRSRVTLTFDDGSRVELGPNSSYKLEDAQPKSMFMSLSFGSLKAWVEKVAARRFQVRTPTAVCSVRGTQFGVNVAQNGATQVSLFQGLLGVADQRGNEVLLHDGQGIGVGASGLGRIESLKAENRSRNADERALLMREVKLDMSKADVLAMAAREIRNAAYKEGKTMIDVNGDRVRIEDYILRPAANEAKFVVMDERQNRFDYFLRDSVFNTALPDDLSTAFRQLPGCVGAPCTYALTSYETIYSNTTDNVHEVATGGHQVDVNNNGVAGDNVTAAFDPSQNRYVSVGAGTPFYTTLFDNYHLDFDGVTHNSWSPNAGAMPAGFQYAYDASHAGCVGGVGAACGGIQSMGDSSGTGDQRTVNDVVNIIASPNCTSLDECTGNRDPGLFHDIIYRQNGTGTVWDKFDNYIVDDNGKVATWAAFGGSTSGTNFKQNLLNWNYEQIITASEFQGRKIDLVFEPKILIESGLVQ